MSKLKIVVVPERVVTSNMAGCGKNNPELCGIKSCSFTPETSRDD